MSIEFWDFFCDIPTEGYKIEGSHCTGDKCFYYEGNIDLNSIWTFELASEDGNKKTVETSVIDFFKPTICFNIKSDDEIFPLEVSPESCTISEDGVLHISKNYGDQKFEILMKKS